MRQLGMYHKRVIHLCKLENWLRRNSKDFNIKGIKEGDVLQTVPLCHADGEMICFIVTPTPFLVP